MKIFLVLILICSAIFASSIPDISFVSRDSQYLLAVKAKLENPKISYDSKGNDLLIVIETPSVAGQDTSFVNKCEQCNRNFVVSEMVTKISDGSIKILLKNSKLLLGDISLKQKDDMVLFYWGELNQVKNNTEIKIAEKKEEISSPVSEMIEVFPLNLVVTANSVNLRKLPSANAELVGKSKRNEKFVATQKYGQWYQVKTSDGIQAWIHESVVSVNTENVKKVQTPGNNSSIHEYEDISSKDKIKTDSVKTANAKLAVKDNVKNVDDTIVTPELKKVITYKRKGRDPFLPLDKSDFLREGLPNINNITLVGILYDSQDAIALLEEERMNEQTRRKETFSFSLKIGDPIFSGKLLKIEPNKAVFLMREATFSYTVEKELIVN